MSSTMRGRLRRTVLAGTAALALAATMATASAAPMDDPDTAKRSLDSQLDQLREELHDTEATLAAAFVALKETEARIPAAQAALDQAQGEVRAAEAADAQAAADLQLAQANEKKAEDELASTADQIVRGRGRVAAFAGQIYMEQGLGSINVAVDSNSPQQFADRLALVGAVMDSQHSTLSRLATAKASQTAQEAHLTALRGDSEAAKKKAEDAVKAKQAAQAAAASAKAEIDKLASDQRSQAANVQAQVEGQRQREAEMQAESDRLASVIQQRAEAARQAEAARRAAAAAAAAAANRPAPAPAPPQPTGGAMAWPLPGGAVTSEFGYRTHPITGTRRLHAGIDIATPCGQPIVAAMDGTVVSAGWAGGYGNQVVLDHGIQRGVPVSTSYNHMQSIAVNGGTVRRGQVVGYEGTTGFSTGCHLHFEVYQNGSPVNPRGWL